MFNARQTTTYTNVNYYSLQSLSAIPNPNHNPNSDLSSLSSASFLHPAAIDPYAASASASYPPLHGDLRGHPTYYHDPNAVAQNWVVKQAAPVQYSTDVGPFRGTLASMSSNRMFNGNPMNQPLMNKIKKRMPKLNKVSQAMRCDLCNIDCNSIDIYEKHLSGKKHKRKLETKYAPNIISSEQSSQPIDNGYRPGKMGTDDALGMPGFPSAHIGQDLDKKKQKLVEGGTAVDSVKICTTCSVVCNSEIAFADHLAGKKHSAQVVAAAMKSNVKGTNKKIPKEIKNAESAWCDVCKISCNSADVFSTHKLGKKHQKNLEKLQKSKSDSIAPASTDSVIQPVEKPQSSNTSGSNFQRPKKKAAQIKTATDLETKKRKIMEGGVAADAVRTCAICNVVCNSETVFNSHLAGQKHAAMLLQKQAEAGTVSSGPQLITAAT
ncbi:hypothetical protein Ancab_035991 [Ancistrocladus abbreviatus]